jgi:hypothetical protein
MKNVSLLLVLAGTLLLASCSKCTKCTRGSDERSFCEDNYSSSTVYEAEVTILEGQGYACAAQ